MCGGGGGVRNHQGAEPPCPIEILRRRAEEGIPLQVAATEATTEAEAASCLHTIVTRRTWVASARETRNILAACHRQSVINLQPAWPSIHSDYRPNLQQPCTIQRLHLLLSSFVAATPIALIFYIASPFELGNTVSSWTHTGNISKIKLTDEAHRTSASMDGVAV